MNRYLSLLSELAPYALTIIVSTLLAFAIQQTLNWSAFGSFTIGLIAGFLFSIVFLIK